MTNGARPTRRRAVRPGRVLPLRLVALVGGVAANGVARGAHPAWVQVLGNVLALALEVAFFVLLVRDIRRDRRPPGLLRSLPADRRQGVLQAVRRGRPSAGNGQRQVEQVLAGRLIRQRRSRLLVMAAVPLVFAVAAIVVGAYRHNLYLLAWASFLIVLPALMFARVSLLRRGARRYLRRESRAAP